MQVIVSISLVLKLTVRCCIRFISMGLSLSSLVELNQQGVAELLKQISTKLKYNVYEAVHKVNH